MKQLQFINHAAFSYESKDFLFICDPWIEGTAFNNGWSLLDKSTSNDQLISKILDTNKPLYIWYSHEHSDHFSISFLEKLKLKKPKTKIFFQSTNDNRLASYLNAKQFSYTIIENGKKFKLGSNSWLSIHSWRSGDSLCVIHLDGINILNVNDCIISTIKDCKILKKIINKLGIFSIDILFTQFGYASWCGNEEDKHQRIYEAEEKLKRIALQIKILSPKNTLLFASFVYFSNEFNFYLNDCQNTPSTVRKNKELTKFKEKIFFLKPWDKINLNTSMHEELKIKTKIAEAHWQSLYNKAKILKLNEKTYTTEEIDKEFKSYIQKVNKNFLGIFSIAQLFGFIKPIVIKIIDLNKIVELSYYGGMRTMEIRSPWDIAMSSSDLIFSISKEFGFDCTHINGRIRAGHLNANSKFLNFAGPQNMLKMGFGWKKPLATIGELSRVLKKKLAK